MTPDQINLITAAEALVYRMKLAYQVSQHMDLWRGDLETIIAALSLLPSLRAATLEEAAKLLDDAANDWNRIRDPGMANSARAYAKKIRALKPPTPETTKPLTKR